MGNRPYAVIAETERATKVNEVAAMRNPLGNEEALDL